MNLGNLTLENVVLLWAITGGLWALFMRLSVGYPPPSALVSYYIIGGPLLWVCKAFYEFSFFLPGNRDKREIRNVRKGKCPKSRMPFKGARMADSNRRIVKVLDVDEGGVYFETASGERFTRSNLGFRKTYRIINTNDSPAERSEFGSSDSCNNLNKGE
jgi:hypothetical protein